MEKMAQKDVCTIIFTDVMGMTFNWTAVLAYVCVVLYCYVHWHSLINSVTDDAHLYLLLILLSYSKDFKASVVSSVCPKWQHFPICAVQYTENFPSVVFCHTWPRRVSVMANTCSPTSTMCLICFGITYPEFYILCKQSRLCSVTLLIFY